MAAKVIASLPSPFSVFETLNTRFAFLRIHGMCEGETKTYQLFSFMPEGRLYSQRIISGVDCEKLMTYLGISSDFVSHTLGYGSVYLQVEQRNLPELLE